MKIHKDYKKAYFISYLSLLITLLVFIFGTLKDFSQQKILEDISYKNLALSYRPEVIVVKPPKIKNIILTQDTTKENISHLRTNHLYDHDYDGIISVSTEVEFSLRVANINNHRAILIAYVLADTSSFYPFLDADFSKRNIVYDLAHDILKPVYLINGDTIDYDFTYNIQNINDDFFVLHFLLLYENEADILYNTYYQAKYKLRFPDLFLPKVNDNISINSIHKIYGNSNMLEFIEDNLTSYFYSPSKSRLIKDYFTNKFETLLNK